MSLKKIRFLLLSLFLYTNALLPSIIASTLIKTPHGCIPVENIAIGDTITTYSQKTLSHAAVNHLTTATTSTLIAITTEKGTFYACPDQQFFDPILQQWIGAKDITTNNTFLDTQLKYCACLNVETIYASETKTYRISTTSPHNFFVTEQELLTHNAFPVVIGLAWLFGEGLKFAGLTIGTTFLGSYVGMQLHNRQKQKDQNCNLSLHIIPCGNPCPDPDDDENNERKFNTISKSEFFKKVKNDYEHYKNGIYRRKKGAKGIEKAEYLEWDHLHGDVEAYAKGGKHLGSIDPKTLKIYKGPVVRNIYL